MLEQELAQTAIPLHGKRLGFQVEAHPGALTDALQQFALQHEVEQEHRLEGALAFLVRGIGDVVAAAARAERRARQLVCRSAGPG